MCVCGKIADGTIACRVSSVALMLSGCDGFYFCLANDSDGYSGIPDWSAKHYRDPAKAFRALVVNARISTDRRERAVRHLEICAGGI